MIWVDVNIGVQCLVAAGYTSAPTVPPVVCCFLDAHLIALKVHYDDVIYGVELTRQNATTTLYGTRDGAKIDRFRLEEEEYVYRVEGNHEKKGEFLAYSMKFHTARCKKPGTYREFEVSIPS